MARLRLRVGVGVGVLCLLGLSLSLGLGVPVALAQGTDFPVCYGHYCGLESACVNDVILSPETRMAPVDKLDAACFLHDLCYTCSDAARNGTSDGVCCPDAALIGVDRAECDRVFLQRLRADGLCDGTPLPGGLGGGDEAERLLGRERTLGEVAGCSAARLAAIALFEAVLAGREGADGPDGSGQPSGVGSPNATCPTFQCPYTGRSACFQPCGDDGCGAQCGGLEGSTSATDAPDTCGEGFQCDPYAHACFRANPNSNATGGDGDGVDLPWSAAQATSRPMQTLQLAAVVVGMAMARRWMDTQ